MASRSGVVFSFVLAVAISAHAQIFEDGREHIVDGPSPGIVILDSPEGIATNVAIFTPADVRAEFTTALAAASAHGGRAYGDMFGGRLRGGAVAGSGGRIRIFGGDVESIFDSASVISDGPAAAGLEVHGGTLSDVISASGSRGEMFVGGGVINGAFSGFPPFTATADGGAILRVAGGTFTDGVVIFPGGFVVTTGGSLNDDTEDALGSVPVSSNGVDGDAILQANGGRFSGLGWLFPGSRARISGGEWGFERGMPPFGFVTANIRTEGTVASPTVVEIFGGDFHQGLTPGGARGFINSRENTTLHFYQLESDELDPRLADGSPRPIPVGPGTMVVHFPVRDLPGLTGGFDLFATEHGALVTIDPDGQGGNPSTTIDFNGVPLGTVDFGGNIGPRDTGIADTIVRRQPLQNPKVKPYRASTPIEIVALQLATKQPIDLRAFGQFGKERIFLTLQSSRQPNEPQGKPTVGFRDVNFAMRDFTAAVDVYFDLRVVSLKGPIIYSGQEKLRTAWPIPWSPDPPRDSIDIAGVNSGFYAGVIGGVAAPIKWESDGFSMGSSSATTPWLEPSITLSHASINPKSHGVVTLTVLGSKTFDATTIDAVHTAFGPRGTVEAHGKTHTEDVNGDGQLDAVMHFATQQTGFTPFHDQACLRGRAQQGMRFRACTDVKVN